MWILDVLILLWLFAGVFKTIGSRNALNPFDRSATIPLRGILAIMIIIHHCPLDRPNEFSSISFADGWGGSVVSIFFLLSGYGLVRSFHLKGKAYLKGFFYKRLSRILIPAIIVLFAHVAVEVFVTGGDWYSFLFKISHPLITLPHYWYLVTIIIFYVIYWCLFKILGDSWFSVVIICSSAILYFLIVKDYLHLTENWYHSIHGFAIGTIIAKIEPCCWSYIQSHKRTYLIMSFMIMLAICTYFFIGCYIHFLPGWGTQFFFFVPFMVYVCNSLISLPRCKMLSFLGGISLEVYLVHVSVMRLLAPIINSMINSAPVLFISVLSLSIFFAWILKKMLYKW